MKFGFSLVTLSAVLAAAAGFGGGACLADAAGLAPRISIIHANSGGGGAADKDSFPHAVISTSYGPIVLRLRPDAAPLTVNNYIKLVESGFYNQGIVNNDGNGTTFYRYEAGFVLQGGNLNNPSNSTVPLEYKLPNALWTVGLARDSDPNSGSSEFFINLIDNSNNLKPPNGYAVFAEVVSGFEAVAAMQKLPVVDQDGIHMFVPPMPPILSAKIDASAQN